MHQSNDHHGFVFMGTVGGTLSGMCNVIGGHDLLQTTVLSAVGAVVSFTVSYVLNRLLKKRNKGRREM